MLFPGAAVIAAVSGGADSVALLKVMLILSRKYGLSLTAAHFNHGLRGEESLRDEQFVCDLCDRFKIRLFTGRSPGAKVDSPKKFSEDKARKERYAFLHQLAQTQKADRIALGHNADDQVETVLLNIFRGSGLAGLKGIPYWRDDLFIRPLLEVNRHEILAFLRKEGLTFIEDSSNRNLSYRRNRIRNVLLPLLKQDYDIQLDRHLGNLADIARQEDDYLNLKTQEFLSKYLLPPAASGQPQKISRQDLCGCHEALLRRVIKSLLSSVFPANKEPSFRHIAQGIRFIKKSRPGAVMKICQNWQFAMDHDYLIVQRSSFAQTPKKTASVGYCYEVKPEGRIKIAETNRTWCFSLIDKSFFPDQYRGENVLFLDYDKINPPLYLRTRRAGDWIALRGMEGRKTIKEYFIDQKIPRRERDLLTLLVDRDGVLCIAAARINKRAEVSPDTRRILRIEII